MIKKLGIFGVSGEKHILIKLEIWETGKQWQSVEVLKASINTQLKLKLYSFILNDKIKAKTVCFENLIGHHVHRT